ncbi:MAG: hypothetical protein OEX10_07375 [Candidatus Bathyarchaeota archaeon]|nr:hypothetical protein [Candidatus Bathyarchaeota archaeon]
MNVKKIRSTKALKFLGLLISAMVIAAVSAQVYSFMYITGTAEVTTTGLRWVEGADAPNGTTISGGTVSNLALKTNEGSEKNYTDCLRIQNLDGAESHNFMLNVTSSTGNVSNWQEFNLVLFDNSSAQVAVLDILTQNANVTGLNIPQDVTWRVLFELIPIANPKTGEQIVFTVQLTYESAA